MPTDKLETYPTGASQSLGPPCIVDISAPKDLHMFLRTLVLFSLILLIGCKKDEPAAPPKVVAENDSSKKDDGIPKKEEPKKETKKNEPKKPKLETLDLRPQGIFGVIDVPPGAMIGK